MFNLTRYYSIASLLCILSAAIGLGFLYRQLSERELRALAEDRNLALTQVFGNSLWAHFAPLMTADSEQRAAGPTEIAALHRQVVALMRDTFVVKVKVYDLQGRTVFSTDPSQVGESKAGNPGFRAAAGGAVVSELTHRDTFDSFEGRLEDRDLLASYIPFRRHNDPTQGVFELYYDVTPFLQAMQRTQWQVMLSVAAVLSLLYGLLYGVVRRAQRIIDRQGTELQSYVARIEEANRLLDQRVRERTASLTAANTRLEAEIGEREHAEEHVRALLAEQQAVLDNVLVGIAFLKNNQIVSCNRRCAEMLGYSEEGLRGQPAELVYPDPETGAAVARRVYAAIGDGQYYSEELLLRHRDGRRFWGSLSARALDPARPLDGSVWLFSDISERKAAEDRLMLAAKVFEHTAEGVVITDRENRILAVNKAFSEITGYAEAEVIGASPSLLKASRHNETFYTEMWQSLQAEGHWRGEIWNRRKNGEVYPEWLTIGTVKDANDAVLYYVGVFSDITAIKATQEKLHYLAHHDVLSGLPNRLLFNDRLAHGIERAERQERQLAVMFIDLDHFKNVNDSLGHHVGDELLRGVAYRLGAQLRGCDTLARLGGDEFIVLLEDVEGVRGAGSVAEKLLALIAEPFQVDDNELFISASIGISLFPTDGRDVNTLVRNADAAMYQTKNRGRGGFHFYLEEMTTHALRRLNLETALRRAIDRGELTLHYQPQVNIANGRLAGAEALARWHHPELGMIPPDKFIPLAEENGFILPLGEWVLHTACTQMMRWQAEGFHLPKIAVNLSVKQFERGNFVERVAAILAETGLAANRLELEITESAIMNTDFSFERLDELRRLGVQLSVDDFGTGYSSLSYLMRLPIQKLKIDRSFIIDLAKGGNNAAIVRAIIVLAKSMGMAIIAEGVEDDAQAAFLLGEGCHHAQGFLYSQPVEATRFVQTWQGAMHGVA